jgi:hypothetical protein
VAWSKSIFGSGFCTSVARERRRAAPNDDWSYPKMHEAFAEIEFTSRLFFSRLCIVVKRSSLIPYAITLCSLGAK